MAGLPEDAHALGAWLLKLREAAGLTQAELAQASGVASRTIQRWEAGTHAPVDVLRVLTALGVRLDPPEPTEVRALNSAISGLEEIMRGLDQALTQAKQSDGSPDQVELLRRLESLEGTVESQGKSTTLALRALQGGIGKLEKRLGAEAPQARKGRGQ